MKQISLEEKVNNTLKWLANQIACIQVYHWDEDYQKESLNDAWQKVQKHHPFGWVKHLYFFYYIVYVEDGMIGYANASGTILHDNFKDALGSFTFADGTPFGILEEE